MLPLVCQIEQKKSAELRCLVLKYTGKSKDLLAYDQGNGFLHVPYKKTFEFLTLMLRTGALSLEGKEIVVDLYGRVDMVCRVDSAQNATLWLKMKGQEVDLAACDFVCAGPPHWFIKGFALKFIQPECSYSTLLKAMRRELKLQDVEDIPVEYIGNAEEAIKIGSEPLPELKLTDRTGAFANLWLDYGSFQVDFHDPTQGSKRQPEVEKGWQKDLLETDFIAKQVGASHFYCPMDKVGKSLSFLLELGWKIYDAQGRRIKRQSALEWNYQEEKNTLLIQGKVSYEGHAVNLQDVVGAFNRQENFIQLNEKEVGLIDGDEIKVFAEEGFKVPKSRAHLLSAHSAESSLKELVQNMLDFKGITEKRPSSDFCAVLRPYQQQGVNWLSFLYNNHFHGLLADEMGLGKTVQVIAFLSTLTLSNPVLIVMPTTLLFNWKKELERFLPRAKVRVHQGAQREGNFAPDEVVLTSYATLRLDIDLLAKGKYQCVILDEAQVMKNSRTQIASALCQLQSDFRLSLSGTPIENNSMELWSHFRFLMPDLLGEEDSETQVKRKIRPFLLRRLKQEVAQDLPEKIDQVAWIEMSGEQRVLYERVRSGALQKISEGIGKNRMEIFERLLRLRQICCHPLLCSSLFPEETPLSSAKVDFVLQDLETLVAEGHKVLVYSQFTSFLQLLLKEVRERGWQFAYLDGSTKNREEVVERFQEESSLCLFFISLKAGGVGLNLTAADYVYILDPWWNEAVENQAINRAHRIGRKDAVIAKRFITLDSIEEKMLKLKERKRQIAETFIADEWEWEEITADDLVFLLT